MCEVMRRESSGCFQPDLDRMGGEVEGSREGLPRQRTAKASPDRGQGRPPQTEDILTETEKTSRS